MDKERAIPAALRNPLVGGRLSIETPGQGPTPLALERELDAKLTVQLADYGLYSEGPLGVRMELIRANVPAVVARFGVVRLVSSRGFYLWDVLVAAGTAASSILQNTVATALAASGSATRTAAFGPIAELVVTTGDAAASIGTGYYIPANNRWQPSRPVWIPPNFPMEIGGATANTQVDLLLHLSAPTIAS